jgi:hypothetical protein
MDGMPQSDAQRRPEEPPALHDAPDHTQRLLFAAQRRCEEPPGSGSVVTEIILMKSGIH